MVVLRNAETLLGFGKADASAGFDIHKSLNDGAHEGFFLGAIRLAVKFNEVFDFLFRAP